MKNEVNIVQRLRAREEDAYRELVQQMLGPLVRFAYGFVKSYDMANDIVQEVFVRIMEMGDSFDPNGPLVTYLYAAVRNRSLNMLRGENRASLRAQKSAEFVAVEQGENDADMRNELDYMLGFLTELQSTAVRLRFVEQRTVPEVAQTLEISVTSAERLLRRAMKTLRTTLERKKAEG